VGCGGIDGNKCLGLTTSTINTPQLIREVELAAESVGECDNMWRVHTSSKNQVLRQGKKTLVLGSHAHVDAAYLMLK
jgi:hypothetical protein